MSKDKMDELVIIALLLGFLVAMIVEDPYGMASIAFFTIFIVLENIYEEVADE